MLFYFTAADWCKIKVSIRTVLVKRFEIPAYESPNNHGWQWARTMKHFAGILVRRDKPAWSSE
jgi:hypothetical protein